MVSDPSKNHQFLFDCQIQSVLATKMVISPVGILPVSASLNHPSRIECELPRILGSVTSLSGQPPYQPYNPPAAPSATPGFTDKTGTEYSFGATNFADSCTSWSIDGSSPSLTASCIWQDKLVGQTPSKSKWRSL